MATDSKQLVVLGIGGAGGRVVNRIAELATDRAYRLVALDTDAEALAALAVDERVQAGAGASCAGDSALGREGVVEVTASLDALINHAQAVILVGGLGGGCCSGAMPAVMEHASKASVPVFAIASLPFSFEGGDTVQRAAQCEAALHKAKAPLLTLRNDMLTEYAGGDRPFAEALAAATDTLATGVRALVDSLTAEQLLPTSTAHLARIATAADGTEGRMGVGQADGDGALDRAVKEFCASPLLGADDPLARARAAMVMVVIDETNTQKEIRYALGALVDHLPDSCATAVGIQRRPGKQKTTIVGLLWLAREKEPPKKTTKTRTKKTKPSTQGELFGDMDGKQGLLPLQEQDRGIFSDGMPTKNRTGQDLDIPTFQRQGIHIDKGD
ncbi:MAG: hypothetical protein KAI66_02220 [Lentisphaeria bacterium]|nr:hypothetical protein [Lentisphaeria bacterium]